MKNNSNIASYKWFLYFSVTLLVLSFFVIYLSPYWSSEDRSRPASLVRVMLLLTSLSLIVYLIFKSKVNSSWKVKIAPVNILLSIFLLYLLGNVFLLSDDLQPARRLAMLFFVFLPFLFINLNTQLVKSLIILFAILITAFAAYSIINLYLQGELPTGYRVGAIANSGTDGIASFGTTIDAAMHYAIGFTLLTYLFFTESKSILLWLWVALLSFIVMYIVLTFARSAWVACLIAGSVIYILTFNKRKKRFFVVPVLLVLVVLLFIVSFMSAIDYELGQRGLTGRDEVWANVISQIEGHWVFGYGLSTPFEPIPLRDGAVFVHNSHNVYLEIIYQTGLVGLLLYFAVIISVLYTLFKAYFLKIYSDISILLLALLSAVSVIMLIELHSWIHTPNLLWMWLWVPVAVSLSVEREINTLAD